MSTPSNPTVSVLLPVYNTRLYIKESVESILQQTFNDFELIIIDDASTDGTQDIIKGFTDNRIVFIQKEKNSGYTESLNLGIELAKGKYIARMDADDISLPQRLEKQVAFLEEHEEVVVCGADADIIGSIERITPVFVAHDEIVTSLLVFNPMIHPVIMLRRSFLIENAIRYNPTFESGEDFELWVRIAGKGRLANLPEVLLRYRHHGRQVSSVRHNLQQKILKEQRIRLLTYLTGPLSVKENEYAEFIFDLKNVKTKADVRGAIEWTSLLIKKNEKENFFHQILLEKYVSLLNSRFIRKYFLGRNKYRVSDISDYLFAPKIVRQEISVLETSKFFLKSFVFWRRGNS